MFRKIASHVLIASLFVWLGCSGLGCGAKTVSGKYVAAGGVVTLEFVGDTVTISSITGTTETAHYAIDGNKLTVHSKDGDGDLTIMSDGSLQGMGATFTKAQ